MMTANIKLTLQYDGTAYNGWQIQRGQPGLRTVQSELKNAVETIVREPVSLVGSGRTDAGVHARGQVANFFTSKPIPEEKWVVALNSVLPADIRVTDAREVPVDFHAQYSATGKTYCYYIMNSPYEDVFTRHFTFNCSQCLDVEEMEQAAAHLVGTKNFEAFSASGSKVDNFERTIFEAGFRFQSGRYQENLLVFQIAANGFLYKMVRTIVGTLLEIGRGKHAASWIEEIIASRNRDLAGPTAPPQGLILEKVWYPEC
jgi:tRNA pseudouridine38-40 synthase